MRLPKLTAFLLALPIVILFSCKSTSDVERDNTYYGKALPMSGSQETPAVTTSATGSIEATYNRLTKTLSYKITFSGISGTGATVAHIHGLGEAGVMAGVLQSFVGFPLATSGTYSGSLLIDGTKFTEAYLLGGRYYMNIHSVANPAGEIRGQLILSKQ
jgi:CHRD domain